MPIAAKGMGLLGKLGLRGSGMTSAAKGGWNGQGSYQG